MTTPESVPWDRERVGKLIRDGAEVAELDMVKQEFSDGENRTLDAIAAALNAEQDALRAEAEGLRKRAEDAEARLARVLGVAQAFCNKLHSVHNDPAYVGTWVIAAIHVGPYTGPTYTAELAALDDVLKTTEGGE